MGRVFRMAVFFAGLMISALSPGIGGEVPWEVESFSPTPYKNGLDQVDITAHQGVVRIRMTLVRFHVPEFELLVIDNGRNLAKARYQSLADALRQRDCLAGSNGSLFNRSAGLPKGVVIWDGHRVESYDPQALIDGVLAVQDGKLLLESPEDFKLDDKVTQLIQSGPMLVRKGIANTIPGPQLALRTFIARDEKDGWMLGYVTYCSLQQLADILASHAFRKILPVYHALNMDGGPSSGLWIDRDGNPPLYLKEASSVMNFIGIRKMKNEESLRKPETNKLPLQ